MGKIIQLEEEVYKKIAAGEVVERPLSVVKELVENSIDAGADSIIVELRDAGKTSIIVKDNGEGFHIDDIEQAFKRHSTSKFKKLTDFNTLNTLGFRGEALPSISEVSLVNVKTSDNNEGYGISADFEGNILKEKEKISFNKGTEITVNELFYNFPVRKKFLKSDRTELNQINSFIEQIALANFDISFKILNNNKKVFNYDKVQTLKERIYQIFGQDFTNSLKKTEYTQAGYSIKGYISDLNGGGSTKKKQFFFVNGRVIREKTIIASFNNSFRKYLEKSRYPEGILLITVPSADIDVNIHPMKLEIKFKDSSFIYNFIKHGIESAFSTNQNEISDFNNPDKQSPNFEDKKSHINLDSKFIFGNKSQSQTLSHSQYEQKPLFNFEQEETDNFKLIGQYKNSYILIEKDDNLILIDQHNANERANFDKLKTDYNKNNIDRATPLFPIIIEMSNTEKSIYEAGKDKILNKMGFVLRAYSNNSYDIKEYPAILNEKDVKATILKILYIKDENISIEDKVLAEIACKSSIKINHKLYDEEMKIITRKLFSSSNPFFCPHGRPIIIEFTPKFIEKKLKRI